VTQVDSFIGSQIIISTIFIVIYDAVFEVVAGNLNRSAQAVELPQLKHWGYVDLGKWNAALKPSENRSPVE